MKIRNLHSRLSCPCGTPPRMKIRNLHSSGRRPRSGVVRRHLAFGLVLTPQCPCAAMRPQSQVESHNCKVHPRRSEVLTQGLFVIQYRHHPLKQREIIVDIKRLPTTNARGPRDWRALHKQTVDDRQSADDRRLAGKRPATDDRMARQRTASIGFTPSTIGAALTIGAAASVVLGPVGAVAGLIVGGVAGDLIDRHVGAQQAELRNTRASQSSSRHFG